jgi:lipid-binding SYLF domain-containing protein
MYPKKLSSIMLTIAVSLLFLPAAQAASKVEINANVKASLASFYEQVRSGKELVKKSEGMLVFPEVYKGGIVVGGEYGEGALIIKGKTKSYYSTAAASIGFQLGAQIKSQIILFMTKEALKQFQNSEGWKAGVDGSVALASLGAGGDIDTETAKEPIIGFIFSNKGLMYNLTFEGAKISKLKK